MALIGFDLDGTLVDPLPAVHHCVRATCEHLRLPCPAQEESAKFIGFGMLGLFEAMPQLAGPGMADQAMEIYWKHFGEEGISLHRPFDGVRPMLARLKSQGHRLCVVSVKPAIFARQVLHEAGVLACFADVLGNPDPMNLMQKEQLMDALFRDGSREPDGYFVGDRGQDMRAARAHGLRAVGVGYGFGSRRELLEAGAQVVLESVPELDAWFSRELPDPGIQPS